VSDGMSLPKRAHAVVYPGREPLFIGAGKKPGQSGRKLVPAATWEVRDKMSLPFTRDRVPARNAVAERGPRRTWLNVRGFADESFRMKRTGRPVSVLERWFSASRRAGHLVGEG
jgi:hypothetical protein